MSNKEDPGAPYMLPHSLKPRRSTDQRQRRNNQSLPAIGGVFRDEKVNEIRNQIDETKNQIILLKARMNALKSEKQRHEKKQEKHKKQINFIKTVRDRLYEDKKYKQEIKQKKEKQLQILKSQALLMREKMIKDREIAKSTVNEQKEADGDEERQRRKYEEHNIKRTKSIELAENQLKAKYIKKIELEIQEKMKQFNESRISIAKKNHTMRVEKSLSEKEKLEKTLRRLRSKESKMIEDCKQSEACMLSTLYELQSLDPEKKRKKMQTSRTSVAKNV